MVKEDLLLELENETQSTLQVLESLKEEYLDWKPHEKSMSVKALATHIVDLHNWFSLVLETGELDFQSNYQPTKADTVAELIKYLNEGLGKNKRALSAIKEDDFLTPWTLKVGDQILRQMPKKDILRYVVNNHIYHHRGQLTVYLRLLNLAVPGIYGPSADEK
ncbi:MAG TPA: DinB family protein [Sphingobacterium sp.]|nr:DinB family protein [Sphingobacterium sp.]